MRDGLTSSFLYLPPIGGRCRLGHGVYTNCIVERRHRIGSIMPACQLVPDPRLALIGAILLLHWPTGTGNNVDRRP